MGLRMNIEEGTEACQKLLDNLVKKRRKPEPPIAKDAKVSWATCCHEAGHAVVATFLGQKLLSVVITGKDSGYARHARLPGGKLTEKYIIREIVVTYAGLRAEKLLSRRKDHRGCEDDVVYATLLAVGSSASTGSAVQMRAMVCNLLALRIVKLFRKSVIAIATKLQEHKRLSAAEVRKIMFSKNKWVPKRRRKGS